MKVIIAFTLSCDNLWKSKFMALEKPGNSGNFFSPTFVGRLCWVCRMFCLYVYLYVYLCVCLYVWLSVCVYVCMSVCISVCLCLSADTSPSLLVKSVGQRGVSGLSAGVRQTPPPVVEIQPMMMSHHRPNTHGKPPAPLPPTASHEQPLPAVSPTSGQNEMADTWLNDRIAGQHTHTHTHTHADGPDLLLQLDTYTQTCCSVTG